MARLYFPRLIRLNQEFRKQGVQIIGVFSNFQDTTEEIQQCVTSNQIDFPVLEDPDAEVAARLGFTRTPEVVIVDQQGKVRYRGRIDDQYLPGVNRSAPQNEDLRRALTQLLSGEPVSPTVTAAPGCLIGRRPSSEDSRADPSEQPNRITYHRDIVPLLQNHCIECHRPGQIGPFPMLSYDDVAGWAPTMLETMTDGRMPPWHADPGVGEFANARHFPESQRELFSRWIQTGMPEGHAADAPEAPDYSEGWALPTPPDQIVSMRYAPFSIPAEGTVEYQYFVVDPGFEEDKFINAAQVLPGNASVVHHAIVFIRPPDGSSFEGIGWLTAYVPGQRRVTLPDGYARRVPAGSRLVFQMHYTTNGLPQQDLTQLGISFCDPASVKREVTTYVGLNQDFEIPPRSADHAVTGQVFGLPNDGELLSLMPHMHFRGSRFEVEKGPENSAESLLRISNYDFNWQHCYVLQSPLELADTPKLRFRAIFDNSAENPFNPDPSEWVSWGDQTWEEMAVVFCEVARPVDPVDRRETMGSESSAVTFEQLSSDDRQRVTAEAERFFQEYDSNGDKLILPNEVPTVIRQFSWWSFDSNNDRQITWDEFTESTIRAMRLKANRREPRSAGSTADEPTDGVIN